MNRIVASLILFVATFVVPPLTALAQPITVPPNFPGGQYRLAFTTSTTMEATSSNISDYNTFVTNVAESVPQLAALGTAWTAIVSTPTVDARDNTSTNPSIDPVGVPIYTLAGDLVANSNASLWSGNPIPFAPIATQFGTPFSGEDYVWTGTQVSGVGTPGHQLGTSPYPTIGIAYLGGLWVYEPTFGVFDEPSPTTPESFYAISGVLSSPANPVTPEPSSMVLACIAAGGLGVAAMRRRFRNC